jgi:hypothetical protein
MQAASGLVKGRVQGLPPVLVVGRNDTIRGE